MAITPLKRWSSWKERNGSRSEGWVTDEVHVEEQASWGDYWQCVQLIKLDKAGGKSCKRPEYVIRFGYYYKNHKAPDREYRWGSQNTLIISKENLRRLLRQAEKKGLF
jgi:hypothetical protein